jgi:hypothetical protein
MSISNSLLTSATNLFDSDSPSPTKASTPFFQNGKRVMRREERELYDQVRILLCLRVRVVGDLKRGQSLEEVEESLGGIPEEVRLVTGC